MGDGISLEHIIQKLKRDQTISTLDLTGQGIGDTGFLKLLNMLKFNNKIATLKVGANNLSDGALPGVSSMLSPHSSFSVLESIQFTIGKNTSTNLMQQLPTESVCEMVNQSLKANQIDAQEKINSRISKYQSNLHTFQSSNHFVDVIFICDL